MAAGRIIIPNCMPALDINGNPVSGAKLTFYVNETTTLLPVYTTSALSVAHPNPLSANAAGAFASIFADTTVAYSVAITDADGLPVVGLRNRDNVKASLFYGDDVVADAEAAAAATAADAISTAADAVSTAADAISTAADAVSTAADAVSTAADVVTVGTVRDATEGFRDEAVAAISNVDIILDASSRETRADPLARSIARAPLLVGFSDGFELDFVNRSYTQIAAVKVDGAVTYSAPDAFLSVTNTGLPTITKSNDTTGLPPHNLVLNSETPAVGDTPNNLTIGQEYRVTMVGAGSLTIIRPLGSGGASIGTATEATPLVFTADDTRIRVSAVNGVVTRWQLQHSSADDIYVESGGAERYGVAISKRAATSEMCLMIDPSAGQTIQLTLSDIPALGSAWLIYLDCYCEATGDASTYLLNVNNGTGLANYFSLRSDGVVKMNVASTEEFAAVVPEEPVATERFEFSAKVEDRAVIFGSQGNPSGTPGTQNSAVFTPTIVTLGNWFGSYPPGVLHIRRFAILPVA